MKKYLLLPMCVMFLLLCACSLPRTLEQEPSKQVLMDSIRIHYKTAGSGKQNIVFVHGFGCDLNSWQEQYAYFADKATMLFIDLPGYGDSDKPQTEYTLHLFADAVKAVMDKEQMMHAVLVGHSLGTPVCRQLIFDHPSLAEALVDIDGVYCFYPTDSATVAAYHAFSDSFDSDSVKQHITAFVESLCTPGTPTAVKDYALRHMPQTPRRIAYSTMRNLIEEKYWPNQVITVPVLVLAASHSQIPPDYRQTLARLYPHMQYHELDNVGHFIMMEQPQMFNHLLDEFMIANP